MAHEWRSTALSWWKPSLRSALCILGGLLLVDTLLKLGTPAGTICTPSADGSHLWCVPTEHTGKSANWSIMDVVAIGFFFWPVTRLWTAIALAGSWGNAVWSERVAGVPNMFIADGTDGVGILDWPWVNFNQIVVYNLADVCILVGGWMTLAVVTLWSIRLFVRVWGPRHTSPSGIRTPIHRRYST